MANKQDLGEYVASRYDNAAQIQVMEADAFQAQVTEAIQELVDFVTDILFLVTLNRLSTPGSIDGSFFTIDVVDVNNEAFGDDRDIDFYFRLFLGSLFIITLNMCARLVLFFSRFAIYMRKMREHGKSVVQQLQFSGLAMLVMVVFQVEPFLGLEVFRSVARRYNVKPRLLNDSEYRARSFWANVLFLVLEDIPQFVVQLSFAYHVTFANLTATWYIAVVMTSTQIVVKISAALLILGNRGADVADIEERQSARLFTRGLWALWVFYFPTEKTTQVEPGQASA